jgi:hypothetical protein
MKNRNYIILITLFLLQINQLYSQEISYPKDSLTQNVFKVDISSYLRKELCSFMLNDTIRRYYDSWDFMDYDKGGCLSGLYLDKVLNDSQSIGIKIYMKDLKHVPQYDLTMSRSWDFNKLILDKITGIKIYLYQSKGKTILLAQYGITPRDTVIIEEK